MRRFDSSTVVVLLALTLAAVPARADAPANADPLRVRPAKLETARVPAPAPRIDRARPAAPSVAPGTNLARVAAAGVTVAPPAPPPQPAPGAPVLARPANGSAPVHAGGIPALPLKLLYAPAADDDPAFRAELMTLTGGNVDYIDARLITPTVLQLSAYDCVYTWPNNDYDDPVAIGDALADYVDAGGKVVLGVFCTFTLGAELAGRIMTSGYSPVVSPSGNNHYQLAAYAGDGTSSLHAGVLAYGSPYRDSLMVQGTGVVDGHFDDGEIATAYRPDGRVVYVNSGYPLGLGSGDVARIIANAWTGIPTAPSVLYAPSDEDNAVYRDAISGFTGGPVNYFDVRSATPDAALLATYDAVHTWAWSPFSDPVLWGDRLADFVDDGGRVVLGAFSTFTGGNFIAGRIMTSPYCPVVSPTGTNHYTPSDGLGDGTTCLHDGVAAYDGLYRDRLIVQGAGIVDGHFADGEIAQAYRPDGRVVYSNGAGPMVANSGDWPRIVANAVTCTLATGPRLLYAPSENDDPAFRALLSTFTGGPVDYFDARVATPTLAQLEQYDCVFTWTNYAYFDRDAFGNVLATFVDRGGRTILGAYCTFTVGNSLGGAIMGSAYNPVISAGGPLLGGSAYDGTGVTRLLHGVTGFNVAVHENLVLQGAGMADGHYVNGAIAVAYRPDRRVISLNGALSGTSTDWAQLFANACLAPVPHGLLYGTTGDGKLLTFDLLTGAGTQVGTLPHPGANELEIDGTTGQCFYQLATGTNAAQQIFFRTGTGIGPAVPNDASYAGFEHALGRLYATEHSGPCGLSELRILNPWSGTSTTIGPTGLGPVLGLAFEPRASTMIGIGAACEGPIDLLRIDLTDGTATTIGPPGVPLGSIEFGPDGDLYGGGTFGLAGELYRIHPTTGHMKLVGPSGFGAITGLALAPPNVAGVEPAGTNRLRVAATPNPSRGGDVRIAFALPRAADVTIEVFDIAGRTVWRHTLAGHEGEQSVTWNGRGSGGQRVAGGVYLARLTSPHGVRTARIVSLE